MIIMFSMLNECFKPFIKLDFFKKGSKLYSLDKDKKGNKHWLVVLENSPQLWQKVLNFRTQILYQNDIGMIILALNIQLGSFVLEAGLESGSLSFFIAKFYIFQSLCKT